MASKIASALSFVAACAVGGVLGCSEAAPPTVQSAPEPEASAPANPPVASEVTEDPAVRVPTDTPPSIPAPNEAPGRNRLADELSPYLLQHAQNPVHWYPWGEEAFAAAKRLNRPILLSIGYSTCHWCHVMEHESFEDEEIAEYLNQHYIAIKVDREERPDVDAAYMSAVQAMRGRGGWPMTVWMTPSKLPYFAGTYFPARDGDRGKATGFLTLLGNLSDEFQADPLGVASKAAELADRVVQAERARARAAGLPPASVVGVAASRFASRFDAENGGFGRGTKFPRPAVLELLMRHWRRSGDSQTREMILKTLDSMRTRGLYDHLEDGFHRYTVDPRWAVPHFEKMLYDNAQLAALYAEAAVAFSRPEYAEITRRTLDYVSRDMTDESGGFYSATDADSEGEEGLFAVWTPAQVRETVLDPKAAEAALVWYAITPRGNFEHGTTVLSTPLSLEQTAKKLGSTPDETRSLIEKASKAMFAARLRRPQPLKDDKIIAGWNGLMITAFARAGELLGEPRYVNQAVRAAEFLLSHMVEDGRLRRRYRAGELGGQAVLEDYAYVMAAFLDVARATGDSAWIGHARAFGETVEQEFRAEEGAYYQTPASGEALYVRLRPDYDGARPSGNSVLAVVWLRLWDLTSVDMYRERADRILSHFADSTRRGPTALPKLLCAVDQRLQPSPEVVLVRPAEAVETAFDRELRSLYVPSAVVVRVRQGADGVVPIAASKSLLDGRPTAYVCEGGVCQRPTTDPAAFRKQLLAAAYPTREAKPPE